MILRYPLQASKCLDEKQFVEPTGAQGECCEKNIEMLVFLKRRMEIRSKMSEMRKAGNKFNIKYNILMTIIQRRFVENNVKMIIIDFNACLVNFNLWFVHEYFTYKLLL